MAGRPEPSGRSYDVRGAEGALLDQPCVLQLPFSPESAGAARRALDGWLSIAIETGGEFAEDCQLVLSELVGNAIRHAQPLSGDLVEVTWARDDGGVDIAVADGGSSSQPRRVDAGLSDLAGRGLAIVEALASRWWIETSGSRTTVHALLEPA